MRRGVFKWAGLALAFLAIALLLRALTLPMGFGDAETYLLMAQHVGDFTSSPHGYRVLVPYLATAISWAFQISLFDSFLVLTLVAFVGVNMTLVYWFNVRERLPLRTALLLAGLYTFSYAGVYNLHNVIHVGYWEHWFILIAFIAIYYGRFWLLAVTVFCSAWIKETVLLLFPLEFVMLWRTQGIKRAAVQVGILSAIFLVPFLLLRSGMLLRGAQGFSSYSNFYTPAYIELVIEGWSQINPLKEIYFAFGVLWLLATVGWVLAPARARWISLLVPLALLQILLATDTQRVTVLAFPAILLLVSILFMRLAFPAQCFLACLNPLLFLIYDLHAPYLLLLSAWALIWLTIWLASPLFIRTSPFLAKRLDALPLRHDAWLLIATAACVVGTLGLLLAARSASTAAPLALTVIGAGMVIGSLALIAPTATRISLFA